MKKLIPTICMFLLAASLLGTSTFAWFTMNNSVTASGMKVKASAGAGLVIQGYNNDFKENSTTEHEGWTTAAASVDLATINTSSRAATINPTSTIDAVHWMTATAAASDSFAKASDGKYTYYDDTAINKWASTCYLYNKVQIKTNDGQAIDSKHLEITGISASNGTSNNQSGESENLNKCIRIAFIVNDGTNSNVYIYAPNEATYPDINGVKYTETTSGYSAEAVAMKDQTNLTLYGSSTSSFAVSTGSIAAVTTVEMFVYYDGEDENCMTNNTLNGVDTLTLSVQFAAVDNDPSVSVSKNDSTNELTATVSSLGTKTVTKYEWFLKGDTSDTAVGTSVANYTPATSGSYYCKVTLSDSKTYTSDPVNVSTEPSVAFTQEGSTGVFTLVDNNTYDYTPTYKVYYNSTATATGVELTNIYYTTSSGTNAGETTYTLNTSNEGGSHLQPESLANQYICIRVYNGETLVTASEWVKVASY